MLAPTYRESLDRYYRRTYSDQRLTRFASMGAIAVLTVYTGVWSLAWAGLWAAAYLVSELAMVVWWRRIQPRLAGGDAVAMDRLQIEMIVICGVSCAICAIPCFITPFRGHTNQVLGVILSAGVLLVVASAHGLRRSMFWATAPASVVALLWNLHSLGQGFTAWLFVAIGLCYVANVRALQLSNADTFLDLVGLQVGADAASKAKSAFLATMSHEIRTPLNGVLGMAQAMRRDGLTPDQREQLDMIGQSGQSLLAILNDILDLSKIEAGMLDLEHAEFDLEPLARGVCAMFEALAAEKGLALRLSVGPRARGLYRGDSVRIRQVLLNLVSNAIKFTASGGVEVRLDRADGRVRVVVADTGMGMDAARIEHLFDRFVQADSTTTRRFGGAGLGLAICRELCAAMGGSITAESPPGGGSRFIVELPLPRLADAPPPVAAPAEAPALADPGLRILAAEDNAVNRLVLKTLLTQAGLEPVLVENGAEAVAAWAAGDWDLILMDVQMPVMDGAAATREIRRREGETGRRATPIVALTANAMKHQTAAYFEAGMNGLVAKPIDVAELFEAITDAVGERV